MIKRGELPRDTGTDGDGVAQIEADTLKNARSVRSGSICAISSASALSKRRLAGAQRRDVAAAASA
jgi:hypothetical protein